MPTSDADSNSQGGPGDGPFRHVIAIAVLVLASLGIVVLSYVAINEASAADKSDTTTLVFTSVLPLLGTWVGAILAYYFSRENLREATATAKTLSSVTAELAGTLSPTSAVRDVMQPENRVERYALKTAGSPPVTETVDDVALSDLWSLLDGRPFDRLPIVDADKVVKGLIFRADLTTWAATQSVAAPGVFTGKKVADLLPTLPERTKLLGNYVTVSPDSTLAQARDTLALLPDSKTIVVTADGSRSGVLAGLLTASDLLAKLK